MTDKNLPALQEKANTIQALFEKEAVKKQLQKAIPKNLTVERLLRVSLTAIRSNPKLLDCTQQSLLACIMGCATLGLEPEPFLGQAYLVPYRNTKKNCFEAQLIPGYRGYLTLARRSGEVQSVSAQVVYNNDYFRLQYGLEEKLEHVPAEGDRGEVKGAYVVFRYKDGSHSFDYMTKDDIDKIRSRSKSPDVGPWATDYAEMAKKTVIRRHVKVAPLSVEIAKTAIMENLALAGESQVDFFMGSDNNDGSAINVASPEPDHLDTSVFDQKVKDKIVPDDGSLDKFLQKTAEAHATTVDALKVRAGDSFESFWSAYETWRNKTSVPEPDTQADPIPCPYSYCKFKAASETGLKRHITMTHDGIWPTESGKLDDEALQAEAKAHAETKAAELDEKVNGTKPDMTTMIEEIRRFNMPIRVEAYSRCEIPMTAMLGVYPHEQVEALLDMCGVVKREFDESDTYKH